MSRRSRVVIVGGGLAGAKVAESLRGWEFDGEILLVGEERARPYARPALSKSYLSGGSGFEDAAVHPESFYATHDVELVVSTRVSGIDIASRTVRLQPGSSLGWDHLVLVTGSRPRRLTLPGSRLEGVFYLRNLDEADAIRASAGPGRRAVVVGAGWIGTEVAASLQRVGTDVDMVYRSAEPLQTTLGREIASVFTSVHRSHGVRLHAGCSPVAIRGSRAVESVEFDDGSVVEADLVVIGAGVVPAAELAEAAGISVDNGVLTDGRLRTSAPGVFAAGDVAAVRHPLFSGMVRSWHWWTALTQPPTVAANIVGVPAVYDWVPTFTSQQFDLMIEHTGYAPVWDSIVVRGDIADGSFVAFWIRDQVPVAGMTANVAGLGSLIGALVAARRPVAPHLLADPEVELAALAAVTEEPAGRPTSPGATNFGSAP